MIAPKFIDEPGWHRPDAAGRNPRRSPDVMVGLGRQMARVLTHPPSSGLAHRDRTAPDVLARDHGISRATAYRYLEEVITVLADRAPDLHRALERPGTRACRT